MWAGQWFGASLDQLVLVGHNRSQRTCTLLLYIYSWPYIDATHRHSSNHHRLGYPESMV